VGLTTNLTLFQVDLNFRLDCLAGLVFVLTGVYESLEREEMTEIIKKYGGKVTTSLSRNTNYLGN
jgi:BRCT domain type II-containing protein